jgi:hypothetical protein
MTQKEKKKGEEEEKWALSAFSYLPSVRCCLEVGEVLAATRSNTFSMNDSWSRRDRGNNIDTKGFILWFSSV